jgi:hypothetical protein
MTNFTLELEDFTQAGLSAEEVCTNIFVVRNFLLPSEIDALMAQFEKMSEEDWKRQYTESLYEFIATQYGVNTFEEAQALGHRIDIDSNWVDKNALIEDRDISIALSNRLGAIFAPRAEFEFRGVGSVQRQYEGVKLNEHLDSESNPLVAYACVIYVNDDFTEGELNFPRLGFKYKPEAGALIVFPSKPEYLHGVLPVGPGPTRYALPAFVNKKVEE